MSHRVLDFLLGAPQAPYPVPIRRDLYVRRFLGVSRFVLRRVFQRLDLAAEPAHSQKVGPAIVFSNHPSFWDPLVGVVATQSLLPEHRLFGPIDKTALDKHWYFRGLGFFGLEPNSVRGYRQLLKVGNAVFSELDKPCLFITPEGRFTDPDARPLKLQRGLAHLLASSRRSPTLLPLAIDYRLGADPKPVAWLSFGESFQLEPGQSPGSIQALLTERLELAMAQNTGRIANRTWGKNLLEAH